MDSDGPPWRRDAAIAAAVLAVILGVVMALAFLARPYGDDFCYGAQFRDAGGLVDFVVSNWQSWSGRWATSALRYLVHSAWGATGAYWTTAVIGATAIVAGTWIAVRALYGASGAAAAWATWSAVLFLSLASDPATLLFWRTSMADYTAGYLLVPMSIAGACRALGLGARPSGIMLLPAGAGMLVCCGLAELFILPIAAFLAIVAVRRRVSIAWLVLVLFAAVGAAFTLFAPGQAARVDAAAVEPGLAEVLGGTILYGLRGLLLPCLALYLATRVPPLGRTVEALAGSSRRNLATATRWLVAGAALAAPFAVALVLFVALGAPGPGRAHNVSLFAIVLAWPLLVACVPALGPRPERLRGAWPRRAAAAMAVIVLLAVNHAGFLATLASGEALAYARRVDAVRERLADATGETGTIRVDLAVPTPGIAPGRFLAADPGFWVNRCVARYFGVEGVAAKNGTGPG